MSSSLIVSLVAIAISLVATALVFFAQLSISSDLRRLDDSISLNTKETNARFMQSEKSLDAAKELENEMQDELALLRDMNKEIVNSNSLLQQKVESLIRSNENLASQIMSSNARIQSVGERVRILERDQPPQMSIEPVAHWTFDEFQTPGRDISANGNDGILNGGPKWDTGDSCRVSGCILSDGNDDFISVPDSANLDLASKGTITAWITLEDSRGPWAPFSPRELQVIQQASRMN